jgi:hypothetical protein
MCATMHEHTWWWLYGNSDGANKTNTMAFSPQMNYTNWATATSWRNLVPTFADREVSCGQRGESPTVVNLSFLDRSDGANDWIK